MQKTVVFYSCSSCLVVDMPVVVHDSFLVVLQVQFSSVVVDIPVFTQRLIPMVLFVQKTIEIPQFVDTVADVPVMWPCRSSVAAVEKTARDPIVAIRRSHAWTRSFTRLLFATTDAWWFSVQKTAMSRSSCSRGVELIVASCHRSWKSCRCSAC